MPQEAHKSTSATWMAKLVRCASSGKATRDVASSAANSSSNDQPECGRSAASHCSSVRRNTGSVAKSCFPIPHHCGPIPVKTNPIWGGPDVATRPDDTLAFVCAGGKFQQIRGEVFRLCGDDGETAIVVRAPFGGRVAEVAKPEAFAVSIPQTLRVRGRQFFQRFRSLGGEGQQARDGGFGGLAAGLLRRRLENNMGIRATERRS